MGYQNKKPNLTLGNIIRILMIMQVSYHHSSFAEVMAKGRVSPPASIIPQK